MFSSELSQKYQEATRFLTNSINKNKLANSYIFVGKSVNDLTLFAVNLAKILNCEKNKSTYSFPCGTCISCKWIEKNEHPQAFKIITTDSESKKDQIKIDTIRELLKDLLTTSQFFRVIFFQKSNLQSLTSECCNLLLKTVEETPGRTVFIFGNNTRNDILPTILSRSQIIYFTNKTNLLEEVLINKSINIADKSLQNCFSKDMPSVFEKTNKTQKFITENEINLKDYLSALAAANYEKIKYTSPKLYCCLYESLNTSYLKYNCFMQPKIILEDLFLQNLACA